MNIGFTVRKDGFHFYRNHKFTAVKIGNGVGVVISFEPSQIDMDFQRALHPNEMGVWTPSQKEMDLIQAYIDRSDYETAKLLKVEGWTTGPRPFKLEEFM